VKVVIDSSAILSVLFAEPDSDEILIAISNNECVISAGNYLETAIVVDSSKDPVAVRKFDALASTTRRKLLCKGDDFRHTDIAILALLSD